MNNQNLYSATAFYSKHEREEITKMGEIMKDANADWAGQQLVFTIGSNDDVSQILVKFKNFPDGRLCPGQGFNFFFEVDDSGKVSTDAWFYEAVRATDPIDDTKVKVELPSVTAVVAQESAA